MGGQFCSPNDILDSAAMREALNAAANEADDAAVLRIAAVRVLQAANTKGRDRIATELRARPFAARAAIRAYTYLTDQIVTLTFEFAQKHLHPKANPTASEQICLLAVGGYGRAEMAPFSDIDLLFLTPYKQTAWGESIIESMLYILWDLKLKVGQAVRTVDDCLRLGKSDITIRTALLEHRFLAGQQALAAELDKRLWSELFSNTGKEFIEAKLDERETRHQRHGGSRYLLEPNVKEGKGGLRDLQTLFWIAKYLNHAHTPADMVRLGVFTQEELLVFQAAEDFLWATRCHLHLTVGRASEQLTFDTQVEVARILGFSDSDGQRGVERFMQQYFTHAKRVGELTRVFIAALEEKHLKKKPNLARALLGAFGFGGESTRKGYVLKHGRLMVADANAFTRDPVNILRLFQEAMRTGILLHPDAMRMIRSHLHLIDDAMRNDAEANSIFLGLLLSRSNPERALRRMNELGVLGAFMPEFGRIENMMQFNMYHHYTVDEHTIQCVSNLFLIEKGELIEELPVASGILQRGVNRRVIYVAMLLHDIGKGLPRDHSEAGAEIVATICPRLGLEPDECETVIWLVKNHLVMSDTAQKRDISDPRTVAGFADIVQSPTRLKLLTVLTVCDIRGVGPNVWNNWKAMLLRDLYAQTHGRLTGESGVQGRPERLEDAKSALTQHLKGWPQDRIAAELDRHYSAYWQGLDTATHVVFANLVPQIKSDDPVIQIEQDSSRDATRACFVMADHPGIFSRLAGALALVGANVVDARTYTTRDGIATAVFWLQDAEGAPYDTSRLARLRKTISQTLKGEVVAREAFKARDKLKKREKDFVVPTEITIDNEGSDIFTIIEVDTRDRPGLLYDLTRTLAGSSISISSAIIATYGEQAVDTFYVKDLFGHKIRAKSKQDVIAEKLRTAIRQGAERAAT